MTKTVTVPKRGRVYRQKQRLVLGARFPEQPHTMKITEIVDGLISYRILDDHGGEGHIYSFGFGNFYDPVPERWTLRLLRRLGELIRGRP